MIHSQIRIDSFLHAFIVIIVVTIVIVGSARWAIWPRVLAAGNMSIIKIKKPDPCDPPCDHRAGKVHNR